MIALEVSRNGKRLCVAGVGDNGVVDALVVWNGHIIAFLDGRAEPYGLVGLETELGWMRDRRDEILDVALINSEEFRRWAVRASRRLFGQRPRG